MKLSGGREHDYALFDTPGDEPERTAPWKGARVGVCISAAVFQPHLAPLQGARFTLKTAIGEKPADHADHANREPGGVP